MPAAREKAEWFAALWHDLGLDGARGVHLRRVHYRINAQREPLPLPAPVTWKDKDTKVEYSTTVYENSERCWEVLGEASKAARYLRLVDPDAFVDRRNPDPHVYFAPRAVMPAISYWIDSPSWKLPSVEVDLSCELAWPDFDIEGYEYLAGDQPVICEIWAEKSTMNDVLLPLGRELGVNVATSLGFQSITNVLSLLRDRARDSGKAARIFYVSDFDPSGDAMPTAVARQIEYWLPFYSEGADIALTPVALTRDQAERYRLPRKPVKDSDRRKAAFEERHGAGAVELDALEALYPGELAKIIREAVKPYHDDTLADRLDEAYDEACEAVSQAWEWESGPYYASLSEIESEARAVVERYEGELGRIQDAMEAELEPLRERLENLRQDISEARDRVRVSLPDRPGPELGPIDESGWLYHSKRDYFDQLEAYKARRNGEDR